jgi:signal transduction histidine kinase
VQEHNGIIEVESTPGHGTRFRLEFPSAAARSLRSVEGRREVLSA